MVFAVRVDGFDDGGPIPSAYAFCALDGMGDNRNPRISWEGVPDGTESFAVLCVDPDAPTDPTDVNQEGRTVPASMPRGEFAHWALVDVGADLREIAEGADSDSVTPKGKAPGPTALGQRGCNDYTSWFVGDAEMEGTYGGYDGPCPPWNDEIVHHYVFTVLALDVASLGLSGQFTVADVRAAAADRVLAEASYTGTYTLNPDLHDR